MSPNLIPIIGIISVFIGAPLIVFGSILGMKWIKYKHRELAVRMEEASVLREKMRIEAARLQDAHWNQERLDEYPDR